MKYSTFSIVFLFLISCTSDEIEKSIVLDTYDSFEFGYWTELGTTFFTIYQENVFRRNSSGGNYNFNVPEPKDDYEIAKEVLVDLPGDFFSMDKEIYGCPNCADQGLLIVRWKRNDHKSTLAWRLDPDDKSDTEVGRYTQKVYTTIKALK